MGRIRLRVRDIDYPEPKQEVDANKSQKSQSPRSYRSRGNKTNISSNRRQSESIVDVDDINLSQRVDQIEGTVGIDGGIELANSPDALKRLEVNSTKNVNIYGGRQSIKGAKSEQAFRDSIQKGEIGKVDDDQVS